MVMVFDPETELWHWVIVEKQIEGQAFAGRVDAHCILGPTLKHGGVVVFHADNILYRWPAPVYQSLKNAGFHRLEHFVDECPGENAKAS